MRRGEVPKESQSQFAVVVADSHDCSRIMQGQGLRDGCIELDSREME